MLQEVAVDGDVHALDGEGGGLQPGGVGVGGRLASGALAQAQDVGDHAGAFLGEGLGGQADGAQEIRLLREMRPAGRGAACRACSGWSPGPARRQASGRRGTWPERSHAGRGASRGSRAGDRRTGTLPMTASMRSSGRRVSRKCSMRMSWPGCSTRAIRPERRSSSTPMKRMPAGARARKFPMPQPGSRTVASWGTPRCASAVVHRPDDQGRGVEGGKGRAPGAGVVLRRQERLELVPQRCQVASL